MLEWVLRQTPPLLCEWARRSFLVWEEVCRAEPSLLISEHFYPVVTCFACWTRSWQPVPPAHRDAEGLLQLLQFQ